MMNTAATALPSDALPPTAMPSEGSLLDQALEFAEARNITLPVFSDVALRVQKAANDESYDIAAIEKGIESDPALVAEVLRASNTAFFAGLSQISSIKAAVLRLGLKRMANLVFLATEKNRYTAKNPRISQLMNTLWRHSAACACGSEWIARKVRYPQFSETVFIAALVHDIGKLYLLRVLDQMTAEGKAEAVSPELIVEVIDRAHAQVGFKLLASWNLPEVYQTIVRDHHADVADPANVPLQIVRLANQACTKVGASLHPDAALDLSALPETTLLGLSDVAIAELEILLEDLEAKVA